MDASHPSSGIRTGVIRLILAGVLLLASAVFLAIRSDLRQAYDIQVIPPTCTDAGYSLYTDLRTGSTEIRDEIPANGHTVMSWKEIRSTDGINPALEEGICTVCGKKTELAKYPELGIPVVSLKGSLAGIGKTSEVRLEISFRDGDNSFDCYGLLKHQGHSSLSFPKKNFTLKLFQDAFCESKNKLVFGQWHPEHKYILKANYMDPSQAKNLVASYIWGDMAATREKLPRELKQLAHYGAVDGFPVALYHDHRFLGLYTWNLHKDEDLFSMSEGRSHAMVIANHTAMPEAYFREEAIFREHADPIQESPWELEFCGTEDVQWAKDKFNALIRFVSQSDDETFHQDLHKYLDVDSAVDYLVAMYALGLTEHAAKDLLLVTYDIDTPWIASMYDLEEAFDQSAMPVLTESGWNSGTGSLLWDRLLNLFYPQIRDRYRVLRRDILDPEKICSRVNDYVALISQALYREDSRVNGSPEFSSLQKDEMFRAIKENITNLDEIFKEEG